MRINGTVVRFSLFGLKLSRAPFFVAGTHKKLKFLCWTNAANFNSSKQAVQFLWDRP